MWPFSASYPELSCDDLAEEYDFIIVGGGTSGCTLANRLSSDQNVSVLLVESGHVLDSWASRVPLFSTDFASDGTRTNKLESVPQDAVGGRKLEMFNGRVLGGTSRINSMLYTRGCAAEYEAWNSAGRKGWGFDDVLPLFKRSESCLIEGVGDERGEDGEWTTRTHKEIHFRTTTGVFEAAESLGFPIVQDLNSSTNPVLGCAKTQFTIDREGHRNSAFSAFLPIKLALSRKAHLTICTGTAATKLDIRPSASGMLQADGVFLRSTSTASKTRHVAARKEVILCCGPLANPKILMLSGLGPEGHLKSVGISVLKDLPGVGSHLQDHLAVPTVYYVPLEDSLVILEKRPLVFMRELVKYLFHGAGLLLSPVLEAVIFARDELLDNDSKLHTNKSQLNARDVDNIPNIEIIPIAYDATGLPFDKSKGSYSFMNVLWRPASKGTVRLKSSDPNDPIVCDLNVLSAPRDWDVLRASLRLSMQLAEQMRSRGYPMLDSSVPARDSDADLDEFIIKWARTTYHYSSTCRMAPEGDEFPGVVDDKLRVHGVQKLRVADSSIFPQIIATHLQAPAVMVAERCAELIKRRA